MRILGNISVFYVQHKHFCVLLLSEVKTLNVDSRSRKQFLKVFHLATLF